MIASKSVPRAFANRRHPIAPSKDCGGRCLLELIRARAFQLYEARGREPGREWHDWLQAEREARQQLGF